MSLEIRLALGLQRIAAISKILAQILDAELGYLTCGDRLSYPNFYVFALRTEQFADEKEGSYARVNTP